MDRRTLAKWMGYASGVGLIATATLHTMATPQILQLSRSIPGESGVLLPLGWVAFGVSLALAGILVTLVVQQQARWDHVILVVISLFPLSGAGLQLYYIGFIAPTGMLLTDGALVVLTAWLARRPAQPAA